MSDPEIGKPVRRRRSWYRRRLRIRRALVVAAFVLVIAAVTWQTAARQFGLPSFHSTGLVSHSFWMRNNPHDALALVAAHAGTQKSALGPRVYPYSVIPGGVSDARELREAAARDYVVARHFAKFEYRHARLVRALAARLVYMSYRKQNRIFWTHKQVLLPAGELLLTDGKITARARCGNQVSGEVQSETEVEQPSEDVLNQPVAELMPDRALPFRSALHQPNLPGASAQSPTAPHLFSGGFMFPYLPFTSPISGLCENPKDGDKKHCHPKHRPPAVPEPTTMVLFSSGIAAVFWRYRRTKPSTSAS